MSAHKFHSQHSSHFRRPETNASASLDSFPGYHCRNESRPTTRLSCMQFDHTKVNFLFLVCTVKSQVVASQINHIQLCCKIQEHTDTSQVTTLCWHVCRLQKMSEKETIIVQSALFSDPQYVLCTILGGLGMRLCYAINLPHAHSQPYIVSSNVCSKNETKIACLEDCAESYLSSVGCATSCYCVIQYTRVSTLSYITCCGDVCHKDSFRVFQCHSPVG